ncbi:hypothetical protein Cgig2_025092 [Carnegiea gigantea]|uniref:Uncharacterized protein n=1 Tax=Carnegiea gigantea TaxID=171969 RepID=A0A9Q1QJR4_9CARY|nr:hypothetical protein Cgig2_025092 [Carnegiea gigantea]
MTRSAWKAQLRSAQQVLTTEQGPRTTVPTMVFAGKEAPQFAFLHNDPLVIKMKIASATVWRISIDTDCLKKHKHPRRDIVPLVCSILGFGGQEVNPIEMIRLPLRFGDRLKFKNLEVDFLVVDVPTAYNVILGRVSCLIPYSLTLARRRNEFHLLRVSAFVPAGARLRNGGRPRNSHPPEIPEPKSPRLCINTPSAAGIWLQAPPAFGTPLRLSPPEGMLRPLSPPPR